MDTKPSLISNIIAGIGFFFIIILLIWGFSNLARWTPAFFALFSSAGKTLTITPESPTVVSGNATTISWSHKASKGTYAFVYECRTGLSIDVPNASGTFSPLPCATPYVVAAGGTEAIRIIPRSTVASVVAPFSITYRDENAVAGVSAADAITITNANPAPVQATTTPIKTPVKKPVSSVPGIPDLTVHLIGIGVMVNGTFQSTNAIGLSDTAAVRFEIKNTGTASTGGWYFNASLPSSPTYQYHSVAQQSLAPGDRIEYTLRFTNLAQGGGMVTVTADPQNAIREASESNNIINYQITVLH